MAAKKKSSATLAARLALVAAALLIASGPASASMISRARPSACAAENSCLGIFSTSDAFSVGETLAKLAECIGESGTSRTKFASESREWSSPDPILASYVQKGAGGASPGLYTYTYNNPVVLRDPTGLGVQTGSSGGDEPNQIRLQQQTSVQAQTRAGIQEGISKWGYDPLHASVYGHLKATGQGTTYDDVQGFIAANLIGKDVPSVGMSQSSAQFADLQLHAAGAAIFALTGGIAGEFGVGESTATRGGANILKNKAAGDAFRDEIANALKAAGRDVEKEVAKQTPFGARVIDIEVSQGGKVLGGVETKVGGSRYLPSQRAKDEWLRQQGYPVNVVRDR